MDVKLPHSLLARYSEFVAARIGLHFSQERWRDLARATRHAAKDLGFDDMQACVEQLLSHPVSRTQVEILASHLTVGETYFFRDRASFDALELHVLPELIRSRRGGDRRLRIWSAGCCTGEEAYSIAILLTRLIADLDSWQVSILGTDINPRFLSKASRGVYKDWSFRNVPPGIKGSFFHRVKDGFQIAPRIKALATFAYHNLAEDAYPSLGSQTNAMDVILCRNVLMYFKPARSQQLIDHFASSLVEGGWLFVSPIEAPHVLLPQLVEVKFNGAIAYRKGSASATSRAPLAPRLHPQPIGLWTGAPAEAEAGATAQPVVTAERDAQPEEGEVSEGSCPEASELYRRGHYAEAAEQLRRMVELTPTDPNVMALLARTCANLGRLGEAAQWCTRATQADKLNPRWCYLLATIQQEQGELDAAVMALKRALYLDPNYAMGHFALGSLTRRQGRLEESERHFRNAQATLKRLPPQQVLPESEGITAGRLAEIIASTSEASR
jgi:chemotaxis protein methyltransferase CheR